MNICQHPTLDSCMLALTPTHLFNYGLCICGWKMQKIKRKHVIRQQTREPETGRNREYTADEEDTDTW